MLLSIDVTSEIPIYQQLRDRVVEAIAAGALVEGDSLPATRALAADLSVNFHTVNKAYDLLRQQGLVRLTRKTGAVISRDPRTSGPETGYLEDWQTRARTLLAEAVAHGAERDDVQRRCAELLAEMSPGANQRGETV